MFTAGSEIGNAVGESCILFATIMCIVLVASRTVRYSLSGKSVHVHCSISDGILGFSDAPPSLGSFNFLRVKTSDLHMHAKEVSFHS